MARLSKQFGTTVGVKALFANPTVGALAAHIEHTVQSGAASGVEGAIPRVADEPSYALSHATRRLWILNQMDPASAAYHIPLHQVIDGALDRPALRHALDTLVARHESLRTVFRVIDREPRQVVIDAHHCPYEFVDLSGAADPDASARALAADHASRPFDLATGPLLRVTLIALGDTRHVLLFTLHHIVADGVSLGVIARELAQLYAAARNGTTPALPTLRIQYRDFTAWQNARLDGPIGEAAGRYWREQLAGTLPVLNLVDDLLRPPVLTSRGRELVFDISPSHTEALTSLGRARGASLFMVLVALVKTLLHRHTGDEDIIIGTPSAGRTHADLDDQVGLYLNTLALRDRVRGDMPFSELVQQVRGTATAAFEHQDYPFERLVTELHVPRDLSRSPIFDVMLILQNDIAGALAIDGASAESSLRHNGTSKLDLSFNFTASAGGLMLGIEYNSDIYLESRIDAFAAHLQTLITSVVAHPSCAIGELRMMSAAEEQQVVTHFNATPAAYPHATPLIDRFERQAASTPHHIAATHGTRTVTYRDLDARANQLAVLFAVRAELKAGETAVLAVPSGIDLVASLLALMKLRVATVLAEPGMPASRIAVLVAESGSRAVISERDRGHAFGGAITIALDSEPSREVSSRPVMAAGRSTSDTVLVFFTSGSTGQPKGVPLTNRAIVNELHWFHRTFGVTATDVIPQKTVVSFVDCIVELLLPLTFAAGSVHLRPHDDVARDLRAMAGWFSDIRPTIVQFVPTVFDEFVAENGDAALGSLRALVLSGGPASRQPAYPFRVYNLYGCSECTALSTAFDLTDAPSLARVPIGRPLQNTSVYILDHSAAPCPLYVPGEIYIGGAMVTRGYLGRPDLTAERFIPNPFRSDDRLFRTGDFGRWLADGAVDYLGRRDDQVKIRGLRIECGDIEHALRSHTAITEAVVVARRSAGPEPVLTAYVVPRGTAPTATDVREHLAQTLPDSMLPPAIVFLDQLPRTSSGKIDKRALPDPRDQIARAPRVAPRDGIEVAIAAIWCDVLSIADLSVHDDFLAMGGHSLRAARVASRIVQELSLDVSLVDVFRYPTIATLAEVARRRGRRSPDELLAGPEEEAIAPLTRDELEFLK